MTDALANINNVTTAFFDAFDNRQNRIPDFDQFKKCFVEGSVIGKRTDTEVKVWSLSDFWKPRNELLIDGKLTEFHEWEVKPETSIFNGIAIRHCSYQKEGILDGLPYAGVGTKCFQFVLTQGGWRIAYLLWEDDE